MLFEEHDKSFPFNSMHYIVLYPQNGDRIVTIDSVTSLHPIYYIYTNVQQTFCIFSGSGSSTCGRSQGDGPSDTKENRTS